MWAQVTDWTQQFGPLLIPLVGAWFEQHQTRKEIVKLGRALEKLEERHDARLTNLESRVERIEQVVVV